MRRLADWIGGAVWGVVTYRLWKRWRQPAPATATAGEEPDDRDADAPSELAEVLDDIETLSDEDVELRIMR